MAKNKSNEKFNIRVNLITIVVYICGAILLASLFKLQVIEGLSYREQTDTRLVKKIVIEPERGVILDRTGAPYANTLINYSLEIYKTEKDNKKLNKMGFTVIDALEKRGDKYNSIFPIDLINMKFRYLNSEELAEWKKLNRIPEQSSPSEAYNLLREKYEIEETDLDRARKILEFREILDRGETTRSHGVKIADLIKRDTAVELIEKSYDIPGMNVSSTPERVYTKGHSASHIIGYVSKINESEYETRKDKGYRNNDLIGKTGIEKTFEGLLKGERGQKEIEVDVNGGITGEYVTKDAIGGASVVLTIDSKLQEVTENALETTIKKMRNGGFGKKYNAKGGSAVVMNVKTGEILSMASYPDYNPSSFLGGISSKEWKEYNNDLKPLLNRSIQEKYPPASTFKMVTSLAALNEGATTTKEKINDTGIFPFAHHPRCWIYPLYGHGHGKLNVVGALKNSCNYYFYEMGRRLGIDKLEEYAKYFGLGQKTGVELISENEGTVAGRKAAEEKGQKMTDGGVLSAAIGQSYNSFTPIQMAKYVAMIANGGKQVNPTIIKTVKNSNGTRLSREEINEYLKDIIGYNPNNTPNKEFKKEYIDAVKEGMRAVTGERGGTAYSVFKDIGIEVGGKTGSAQAGYDTNGLFAGFAPFDNPEIAIITVIENGEVGFITGEVVKKIMVEYFGMNIKHIKEDMTAQKEGEFII